MFGNHGLCGLLEEGAHGKFPKCLDGNLGDFGGFCKGLRRPLRKLGVQFKLRLLCKQHSAFLKYERSFLREKLSKLNLQLTLTHSLTFI